jgi:3',5'-cyclic AMP phosphodiesterase CpdA
MTASQAAGQGGELCFAHFSDTHVLSLEGARAREFLNKRATGAVNLALNRSRQYRVEVFERLLAAIRALAPDHTVCTGDLVNLALAAEFDRVRALLREHFVAGALTVVPGNHDAYERDATRAGRFEAAFGDYLPRDVDVASGGRYPVVRLGTGWGVVGLSSAVPTPAFLATGAIGEDQQQAARQALAAPELVGRFRMVMLHHPLLPDPTRPFDHLRRLTDAEAVVDLLAAAGPDLVVHGHNHVFVRNRLPGTDVPLIQVASGSRRKSGHMAEFNVYRIRDGRLRSIERHIYDEATDAFHPHDEWGRRLP